MNLYRVEARNHHGTTFHYPINHSKRYPSARYSFDASVCFVLTHQWHHTHFVASLVRTEANYYNVSNGQPEPARSLRSTRPVTWPARRSFAAETFASVNKIDMPYLIGTDFWGSGIFLSGVEFLAVVGTTRQASKKLKGGGVPFPIMLESYFNARDGRPAPA